MNLGSRITPINTPEHLAEITNDTILAILNDYPGGLERMKERIETMIDPELIMLACNSSNELNQFYTEYLQEAQKRNLR